MGLVAALWVLLLVFVLALVAVFVGTRGTSKRRHRCCTSSSSSSSVLLPGDTNIEVPIVVSNPATPPPPPSGLAPLYSMQGPVQDESYIVVFSDAAIQAHAQLLQTVNNGAAGVLTASGVPVAPFRGSADHAPTVGASLASAILRSASARQQLALASPLTCADLPTGCVVTHGYDDCIKGASIAGCNADLLAAIRADPEVESVYQDGLVRLQAQTIPWGISRIGATLSSTKAGNGSGNVPIDIFVIDTGRPNHPDLNVVEGKSFLTSAPLDATDRNGHGTHCAGTAAAIDNTSGVVGSAPGARIRALRVLNASGSGAWSDVVAGVNYATGRKRASPSTPMVASMSLGAYVGTTAYNILDVAVANSIAAGIVYCVAAGNSASDARLFSPAHVTTAICVGAYDSNNRFASFSNRGPAVTVLAPGVQIVSTWLNGQFAWLNGTSMATPAVAGAAALYLSKRPTASPATVKNAIVQAAAPSNANRAITSLPSATTNRSLYEASF